MNFVCSLAIYSTTSNGKCLVIGCVVTIEGPYRIIKDIFIPWNFQRTKSNRIEKFLSLVKHFLYHFRDPSVKQIVITSFQLHSNKYNRNIFLKNVFKGYSVIFVFNSLSLQLLFSYLILPVNQGHVYLMHTVRLIHLQDKLDKFQTALLLKPLKYFYILPLSCPDTFRLLTLPIACFSGPSNVTVM